MPAIASADSRSDEQAERSPSGPYRALKRFGLVILCASWALLGSVGHDPWKSEDAIAFGVAYEMLERGDALTPALAGEAFTERPPLVYAVAAASAKLFPALPTHDAARIAVVLMLGATLWLAAATAAELYGGDFRWMTVLLFMGSVGLWDLAHQLSPELGLLVGLAAALYGLALARRRALAGGVVFGIGVGVAFLSRGFLGPLWLVVTALALPIACRDWRTRRYAVTLAAGLAVAVMISASWPLALAARAPEHLRAWWALQTPGEYFAPLAPRAPSDPVFLLKNLPWYAWPALPLVVWTLWTRARGFNGGLGHPAVQLPLTLAVVMIVGIALMPEPRAIILMPLLLPLALLGALEIDTLQRGYSGALDWFGILTFGLISALVWWLWFEAYAIGMTPAIARTFRDTDPGYRPPLQWIALAVSLALTLLWLALVRPARRSNRRAVLNWAAGMTLLWGLYSTIWLPYLDSRRSYRTVAQAARTYLPREGCVASRGLGDAQRALFHYFAGLKTVREEIAPIDGCSALLVQYGRLDAQAAAPPGWIGAWDGHRRGDDTERYVLYVRARP